MIKLVIIICACFVFVNGKKNSGIVSIDTLKKGFIDLKNYCEGKTLDFCSAESLEFAIEYLQNQIYQKEQETERERQNAMHAKKLRQENRKREQLMLKKLIRKQHLFDRHF
jgi:hypothetical protein